MRQPIKLLPILFFPLLLVHQPASAQDGEKIFKQNCGACHMIGRRLVGPDLTGITDKRSKEWIHSFVKSSQTMVKSGDPDAVAIFKEYNEIMMPDQPLSAGDVDQVLDYINSFGAKGATASLDTAAAAPIIAFTDADRETGQALFTGRSRFTNKGAACISCHNVTNDQVMMGGSFAKDLTGVYGRMGQAGVAGILGAPPFPAMATAYANTPLTEQEVHSLTAFLEHANAVSADQAVRSHYRPFVIYGGGGLIALLAFIGFHWRGRIKRTVKEDIYDRQLRSN